MIRFCIHLCLSGQIITMQAQYSHQYSMPPQQQTYMSPLTTQAEMTNPFAHLFHIPLFPMYSESEIDIIRKALQQNAETKKLRQDVINNMAPPLTAGEALNAKIVYEFISMMSDGGTTLILKQFNPDKLMNNTLGLLDAMERKMMQDNQIIVYSRWATPRDMPGPPVIVDILSHNSISDPSKTRGVQVKANTSAKFKVFKKYEFSAKEGKEWGKSFFRGRHYSMSISMVNKDGTEVELSRVVGIERGISPNLSVDLIKRWGKYSVPKMSEGHV